MEIYVNTIACMFVDIPYLSQDVMMAACLDDFQTLKAIGGW